jgi:hypothetical protein
LRAHYNARDDPAGARDEFPGAGDGKDRSSSVEVSEVRRRLEQASDQAKGRAKARRERNASAESAYATFLAVVAVPLARQVAGVLKAQGHSFTVFTPGNSVRIAHDRGRDDFVEIDLDTDGEAPQIVGRTSYTRGSRTVVDLRPVAADADPARVTDTDLMEFFAHAVAPWLER